ncbi:MAG TPA: hypothetical protein VJM33_15320 [Microthrixaceae bacterium]|nr:hypothetical protein [Microthrixaceae bacterium]
MIDESVDHLPVVAVDGIVVGMCTRTDVLRVRHHQRHEEIRQHGLARRYWGDVSVDR